MNVVTAADHAFEWLKLFLGPNARIKDKVLKSSPARSNNKNDEPDVLLNRRYCLISL